MNLKQLQKINYKNIRSAGPRYTPEIEPNAPNLEITPLIGSIETIALSEKYKATINSIIEKIVKTYNGSSEFIMSQFKQKKYSPLYLIELLQKLTNQKPGRSSKTLTAIRNLEAELTKRLDSLRQDLLDKLGNLERYSDEWNKIQDKLSGIQKLVGAIRTIYDINFDLIIQNKLFVSGQWGTGKTHSLCDITKQRMKSNLPTLFLLAHRLPPNVDPLKSICKTTGLATTLNQLLIGLNELGKKNNCRALLIIDGINEGNRKLWKKSIPDITSIINKYSHVALILSCRSPFEKQILTNKSYITFVHIIHPGFEDIEYDAQRAFFDYYDIPEPNLPLLTPEFSRPLFLKILCLTISGKTKSIKSKWIVEIASGQKGMTKIFEDFINHVAHQIELQFNLPNKACWRILKGQKVEEKIIGVAPYMSEQVKDYIYKVDILNIIAKITCKSKKVSNSILESLLSEGLIVEDIIFTDDSYKNVLRLPYQRFSDHLIARHLLSKYLNTISESSIRRSFYKNRPLGKVFECNSFGRNYKMPGIASAIMLEFPERVKHTLPDGEREIVFYLPRHRQQLSPLIETFLDGILWRSKDSFSSQTAYIIEVILTRADTYEKRQCLEALTNLAYRKGHPFSAERLYNYLASKKMYERDLIWSEFLRHSYSGTIVYRLLYWIENKANNKVSTSTAKSLLILLSLFLTTTNRALRDKATKAIVLIGEKYPDKLFEHTVKTFHFNDPYVLERMLAACYGVLMRCWSFPKNELAVSAPVFACILYDNMFKKNAPFSTSHILMRDYALGVIAITLILEKSSLGKRPKRHLKKSFTPPAVKIPNGKHISEKACKAADFAIHMDFENYTIGGLVAGRRNYDSGHKEYRQVLRQIKWRILNLGYSEELFKNIDRSISEINFNMEQRQDAIKVDRYGKKYSWIAYYEVAGLRENKNRLPERYYSRIPDCDIDPSFPKNPGDWKPNLRNVFSNSFKSARGWIDNRVSPSYDHLLKQNKIDNIYGQWVMLYGYIDEASSKDPRSIFTFVNGVLVSPKDIAKLRVKFNKEEYPGNHKIPGANEDYYTFAGEIPWSEKFGLELKSERKDMRNISECFGNTKNIIVKKKIEDLTSTEKKELLLRFVNVDSVHISEKAQKSFEKDANQQSKFVNLNKYISIPGVKVEVPIHRFSWESYHSSENQSGSALYLAPALCNFFGLRNKGNSFDLFEKNGRQASVYKTLDKSYDNMTSKFIYIRKDLLIKYLTHTNQKLVWFIWGERGFKLKYHDVFRPQLEERWSKYKHIHKKMKVARV